MNFVALFWYLFVLPLRGELSGGSFIFVCVDNFQEVDAEVEGR
jgi:hypothetical protein